LRWNLAQLQYHASTYEASLYHPVHDAHALLWPSEAVHHHRFAVVLNGLTGQRACLLGCMRLEKMSVGTGDIEVLAEAKRGLRRPRLDVAMAPMTEVGVLSLLGLG